MKLSMLKLLTITTLLSTSLFATKQIDEKILTFQKKKVENILKRKQIELNDVSIILKKDLKQDGWYGYVFNLTFTVQGKQLTQRDTLFTNGTLIAPELVSLKTKLSFSEMMYPTLGKEYFNKENLIAGNADAKHTLVLFSDPLCPICVDEVPTIIKNINENPKNIALYYYSLPLNSHPTAATLSKATIVASKMGIKDADYKLYTSNFGDLYDAYRETNQQVALDHFNKVFKTNITMAQIETKELNQRIQHEIDMSDKAFVSGTPTLFLDGEIDRSRIKYEKYLK